MENYEQKYKEALKIARDLHDNHPLGQPPTWIMCEKIFPELKESEDERIRKSLIDFLHSLGEAEYPNKKTYDCWLSWLEKQKFVEWSEEEETYLGDALWAIEQARTIAKDENDMGNLWCAERWLKSLKPQHKQEWSEEDENMLEAIIDVFINNTQSGSDGCVVYKDYIDWLKSIKPQPKQEETEWGQEDEENLNKAAIEWNRNAYFSPIAMTLDSKGNPNGTKQFVTTHEISFKAGAKWLLNQYKFSKPQSHWKPSEFQMQWLEKAIPQPDTELGNEMEYALKSLYDDLQKQ